MKTCVKTKVIMKWHLNSAIDSICQNATQLARSLVVTQQITEQF